MKWLELWIKMYLGIVSHYAIHERPDRIIPSATTITTIWVAMLNRPRLGADASLLFASTYIDSAHHKVLFGIEGVGYVCMSE